MKSRPKAARSSSKILTRRNERSLSGKRNATSNNGVVRDARRQLDETRSQAEPGSRGITDQNQHRQPVLDLDDFGAPKQPSRPLGSMRPAKDEAIASVDGTPTIRLGRITDRELARERMRGNVAQWILMTLGAVVIGAFVTLWLKIGTIDEVSRLVELIFTPIIGIVGAVTGFYYGAATSSSDGRQTRASAHE